MGQLLVFGEAIDQVRCAVLRDAAAAAAAGCSTTTCTHERIWPAAAAPTAPQDHAGLSQDVHLQCCALGEHKSWRAAALTCMRCNEGPRVLLPARVATLLRDGTCYLLIHSPMLPAWPHLQTKSTVDSKFGDSGFEMPIPLP